MDLQWLASRVLCLYLLRAKEYLLLIFVSSSVKKPILSHGNTHGILLENDYMELVCLAHMCCETLLRLFSGYYGRVKLKNSLHGSTGPGFMVLFVFF